MRLLFCILLLICLPLHSLAAQIAGTQASGAVERLHHHHAADGSIHYDNSAESLQHADEHSPAVQLPMLHPAGMTFGQVAAACADYPDPNAFIPDPCLDDPQRPPAFAPGLAAGG